MRLGVLGVAIAAVGVGIAFGIDYGPHNPLSYVAAGIGLVGIAVTFVAVGWGWYTLFRGTASGGK
jgi:hypothetical protein